MLCYRMSIYHWPKRKVVLEKEGQNYFSYKGKDLLYVGEIHNIYIRLKEYNLGNDKVYFRLVKII